MAAAFHLRAEPGAIAGIARLCQIIQVRHALALVIGLLVGCTGDSRSAEFDDAFDRVAQTCRVPREWLEMAPDGFVRVRAPETARYEDMTCVVRELKARGVPMKQGYVSPPNAEQP